MATSSSIGAKPWHEKNTLEPLVTKLAIVWQVHQRPKKIRYAQRPSFIAPASHEFLMIHVAHHVYLNLSLVFSLLVHNPVRFQYVKPCLHRLTRVKTLQPTHNA